MIVELYVEIEAIVPGVPVFHVKHYAGLPDLYVAFDPLARWHCLTPMREVNGAARLDAWHGDFPPLAALIERAYPELLGGAA